MPAIERCFLGLAVFDLLIGIGLGFWMGTMNDYALVPLHAHLNLLGWVTFALFALAYRTGLARNDIWAAVHFWLSAVAIATFSLGIVIAILLGRPKPAYVGGWLMLASVLLFAVNVWRAAAAERPARAFRRPIAAPEFEAAE